jgi:hypothetical protein
MNNDLIYVFCLSISPPELADEMKKAGLKSLVAGDFYVIVKYVPENEFSGENFKRNILNAEWQENNTREHIKMITLLMEQNAVLPFKFATVFNAENSLRKFITDHSDSLFENFHHIEGKEEWSVRIYCDRYVLSEQIDELSEETAELEKQIMASSPGKAFLLRRKKSELIENEMNRICKSYGQNYYDEFRNLSASTSMGNLLPKEFTGREDTMILNAVFLVRKTKENDLINTVDSLRQKDGNSGLFIEITGPLPPFSFIHVKKNL